MKKYSTENLYLCQLAKITEVGYPNFDITRRKYCKTSRYIWAKKEYDSTYSEYTDIFTGMLYRELSEIDNVGECFVCEAIPCITNMKYMTEEQLIEILKIKNPTFFEVEKEETFTKKLMKTFCRNNKE